MNTSSKDKVEKTKSATLENIALVHTSHGAPAEVVTLESVPLPPAPKTGEALIRVTHAPIHPGDLHFIKGTPQGGPAVAIDSSGRVPGFEGVGVIEDLGPETATPGLAVGTRVAFFPATGAWSRYVNVPVTSLVAVDDAIANEVAAQVLINTITAKIALGAGQASLPPDAGSDIAVIQTAAGSSVGRLITAIALKSGLTPLRLVRSSGGARALEVALPGAPVFATSDPLWKVKLRQEVGERPLWSALDSVGGELLGDVAALLEDGATVVSYGSLSDTGTDVRSFSPRGLTLKGVNIGAYGKLPPDQKRDTIELALTLAREQPSLFNTAGVFAASDFALAAEQVDKPGKSGAVLLAF